MAVGSCQHRISCHLHLNIVNIKHCGNGNYEVDNRIIWSFEISGGGPFQKSIFQSESGELFQFRLHRPRIETYYIELLFLPNVDLLLLHPSVLHQRVSVGS